MAYSELKGKVVVITGGTTGIGETTAVEFAKLGAKLVIIGRNLEGLEDTKTKCVQQGLQDKDVAIVTGDICKEETLDLIVKTAVDSFGRVDVLFMSAGKIHPKDGPVTEPTSIEAIDYNYQIFIKSPYLLTQKLSAELIKTKGAIVINTSTASTDFILPTFSTYSVCKAAQEQMARLFALTFANKGVRVNVVRTGAVVTSVLNETSFTSSQLEGFWTTLADHIPLQSSISTAEEIAHVVVFLASSQSACMTGTALTADKGLAMVHPAVDWKQF